MLAASATLHISSLQVLGDLIRLSNEAPNMTCDVLKWNSHQIATKALIVNVYESNLRSNA